MDPRLYYLLVDLLYLGLPLLLCFSGPAPFYKKWRYLWISTLVTGFFFTMWSAAFTAGGVWEFNTARVIGWYVGNLPVEEVLFYICIPFAGVFIYHTLTHVIERDYIYFHHELISSALSILLMVVGIYHLDKAVTGATFLGLGIFLAFQMIVLKPRYMSRFYFATPFIILLLLPAYAFLTGAFTVQLVVWHDAGETLDIDIGTLPLEALVYGWFLILSNVTLFEWLKMRAGVE